MVPERISRARVARAVTWLAAACACAALCLPPAADAQYFGRNKVLWDRFDFQILETEHFLIHYYPPDAEHAEYVARIAERWYQRLSSFFGHELEERRPLVIYLDHADFQQTVITGGLIGEGVGGFAESLRNRIVLPLTGINADNDHVIGHEIVHAFQFDIMNAALAQGQARGVPQVPLWVMEGLAEYLSQGRHDPATAIVLRDAVLHDNLPEQSGLIRRQLSPYHYGQAIWAYVAGRWGDSAVPRLFANAMVQGVDRAIDVVLGMSSQQFLEEFHSALRAAYEPVTEGRQAPSDVADPLLYSGTTGVSVNLAPSLSPDGRWVAFLSTRALDLDLYLADAETGRIERRLVRADADSHFDNLSFLDSSVAWAPDATRFAFTVFARGERRLAIFDVERRRTVRLISLPGIKGMRHPAWTADGGGIVFSAAAAGGASDLFLVDVETDQLRRLTDDGYSALQPAVSPDGRQIAFVTDRGAGTDLDLLHFGELQLALLDVETGDVTELPIFAHGKHIDPHFSADGESLYFVAEPDGVPDLFRYRLSDGAVERLTALQTGIQGITSTSPALSVANDVVLFSVPEDNDWTIYALRDSGGEPVTPAEIEPTVAGVLPPLPPEGALEAVEAYLADPEAGLLPRGVPHPERAYTPRFGLTTIGPATIGVGTDTTGGIGAGGSLTAVFSDPLNRHQLATTFQGGSTGGVLGFEDTIGADAIYLNQTRRLQWGARLTHVPYLRAASFISSQPVEIDGQVVPADVVERLYDVQRVSGVSLLGQYPFSLNGRIEATVGYQHIGFTRELERFVFPVGFPAFREEVGLPTPESIDLRSAAMAYVRDTSRFGFVSPLLGTRMRVQGEWSSGDLSFSTALFDYRRYFFARPVTFAFRALHIGRHGTDAEDFRLPVLDVGRNDLVRGYELGTFSVDECTRDSGATGCPEFDRLIGSRIAVLNMELRVPLIGTEDLGLFTAPIMPTELALFVDAGAAWTADERVEMTFERDTTERVPVVSAGIAARTVVLGILPLELFYARPYQRPRESSVFGVRIGIGW